jgi:hypothetical protein
VVLDVHGDKRAGMDVADLLAMFEQTRGEKVSDDALLLGSYLRRPLIVVLQMRTARVSFKAKAV